MTDGGEEAYRTPRWVKGFGIAVLVVVLLAVVVFLVAGGEHGPGRHAPFRGDDVGTARSDISVPPPSSRPLDAFSLILPISAEDRLAPSGRLGGPSR